MPAAFSVSPVMPHPDTAGCSAAAAALPGNVHRGSHIPHLLHQHDVLFPWEAVPEIPHLDPGTAREHPEAVHTALCKLHLCPYMLLAPQALLSPGAARALSAAQHLQEKWLLS